MRIYVPSDSPYNACVSIQDSNTIRVYQNVPNYNTTSNFIDFYINSHYISRQGQQTWSSYTNLPSCINSSDITDSVFYRNDIDSILLVTFILLIICFYFPYRIISRLFGRWLKL